jgi:hypothetical protein
VSGVASRDCLSFADLGGCARSQVKRLETMEREETNGNGAPVLGA